MNELIIRALQGRASAAELMELERWRGSRPENESSFRELEALWRVTDGAPVGGASPPSTADIIRAAGARKEATVIPMMQGPQQRKRSLRPKFSLAAIISCALLGSLALWSLLRSGGDPLAATEIVTGPGELVTARLSDGTTVRLAPESRLLLRSDDHGREVWLDGHGFFAVARDEARPFTIRTRAGDAVVLGTRFDIRVQEQELRIAVVEGRVVLDAGGEQVEAGAGQMSVARDGAPPVLAEAPDLKPVLAWMEGFLVFQDTPLAVAASEIESRFGIRVLIPDSALGKRTVSALFTTEDVGEVLAVICRAAGAHCTLQGSVASMEP